MMILAYKYLCVLGVAPFLNLTLLKFQTWKNAPLSYYKRTDC